MKLWKPWQPQEKKELSEEEEIAQTEKMLKKTSKIVSVNLALVKKAGPTAFAMLQGQIMGMVDQQVKEDIQKAKAKGEVLTVDKFMAKVGKIQGIYEFYAKVDITKDDIRAKAEEIIKQEVGKCDTI